jgi:hypothetical protein
VSEWSFDDEWNALTAVEPGVTKYGNSNAANGPLAGGMLGTQGGGTGGNLFNSSQSSAGSGALGFLGKIGDWIQTDYWNRKNLKAQKEQQEYDRALTQTIFDREDNSVQRRVADMKAAGINPVLAAGAGAQAGQPVRSEAPQMGRQESLQFSIGAMEMMKMKADVGRTNAERDFINAQTRAVDENLRLKQEDINVQRERIAQTERFFDINVQNELRRIGISQGQLDLARDQFDNLKRLTKAVQDRDASTWTSEQELRKFRIQQIQAAADYLRTNNEIQQYLLKYKKSVPPELQRALDAAQAFSDTILKAASGMSVGSYGSHSGSHGSPYINYDFM